MFGTGSNGAAAPFGTGRPAAAAVAHIDAHLTQVIVTKDSMLDPQVFYDLRAIPAGSLESVGVEIVAPTDGAPQGVLTGILSVYEGKSPGEGANRPQRSFNLFPGTVELVANGRRVVITCQQEGSFDGLWLGLGLREDGTSTEVSGVQSLRIVIAPNLVDAKLVWSEDALEENLLPA